MYAREPRATLDDMEQKLRDYYIEELELQAKRDKDKNVRDVKEKKLAISVFEQELRKRLNEPPFEEFTKYEIKILKQAVSELAQEVVIQHLLNEATKLVLDKVVPELDKLRMKRGVPHDHKGETLCPEKLNPLNCLLRTVTRVREAADVDDTSIANNTVLLYKTATKKHEYNAALPESAYPNALLKSGGTMTGNIVTDFLVDGVDISDLQDEVDCLPSYADIKVYPFAGTVVLDADPDYTYTSAVSEAGTSYVKVAHFDFNEGSANIKSIFVNLVWAQKITGAGSGKTKWQIASGTNASPGSYVDITDEVSETNTSYSDQGRSGVVHSITSLTTTMPFTIRLVVKNVNATSAEAKVKSNTYIRASYKGT